MRSASTIDKTAQIVEALKGANLKHAAMVEWYDPDTSIWSEIDDVNGKIPIQVKGQSKRTKYANYNFNPLATTAGFTVNSLNGEYSAKAGTAKSDILIKNRQVRISFGYKLPQLTQAAIDLSAGYYRYTEYAGGDIILDDDNSESNTSYYFNDLFALDYDASTYDSGLYSPAGFFAYAFDTQTLDSPFIREITVTANNTKAAVFYGFTAAADDAERADSTNFTYLGKTGDAVKSFTISSEATARYLQLVFIFDATDWVSGEEISEVTISADDLDPEWFTVFNGYLDDPVFVEPSDGSMPTVKCGARDAWKRAIEIDINLQDINNLPLDDVLKSIFDMIGIEYTSASIANLGTFGNYTFSTGYGLTVKADVIISDIMTTIQGDAVNYQNYSLWIDNNIVYLQPTPIDTEAIGVLDYRHYISAQKAEDSGRQVQLYRVLSEDKDIDAEIELDSTTDSGTKSVVLTWSGDAYVTRITVDPVTEWDNISLTSIENEQITFALDGAGSTTIKVYGCKFTSGSPGALGQAGNLDNILNRNGTATKQIIPFTKDDTTAQSAAEGVIDIFGDPTKTMTVKYPFLYLLPEINDPLLIWSRYFFEDDIYFIVGYEHNSTYKRMETSFLLLDSKVNFGEDVFYDDDNEYDKGFKYEMRLGPQAVPGDIDPNDYKSNLGVT